MNYIKYVFFVFVFFTSCKEEMLNVEEITYKVNQPLKYGQSSDFTSICYITPDLAYATKRVRKKLGYYPHGVLLQKTIDGGKIWETLHYDKRDFTGLKYYSGILYMYNNDYYDRGIRGATAPSHIYKSEDMGKKWHKIYTFDSEISNFHVVDSLNMFVVKAEIEDKTKTGWLYQSHDGGTTWSKVKNLPSVKNKIYVPFDENKVYFLGDVEGEEGKFLSYKSYIYSYDIKTNKITKYTLPYYVHALYVSDSLLSTTKKGGVIEYYQIDNEKLTKISDIDWGHFFGGAIMSKPLIKDGNYVFSFISQYPGRNNIDGALFFSDNGGKRWKKVREFQRNESIRYEYSTVSNDTIFQVAYPFADSLRIFRINKIK